MPWYVLYTQPRNEKKVAEKLSEMGFTVYCPLVTVIKQWSDRKKKVQEPLLPSYVFIQIEDRFRDQVFQVRGVVRYLYWLGKPAVVKDIEIQTLRDMAHKNPLSLQVRQWVPGTKVTLSEGPFKGVDAVIKEQRGNRVQLILESLGIVLLSDF